MNTMQRRVVIPGIQSLDVQTDDTVVAIASRCGFGTAETMRRNFIRRLGVPPDQYRRMFA